MIKDKFDEIFTIELEGWFYGLSNYPGEIFPALVHAVIKELAPSYKSAIAHNYAFDILDISAKLSRAAKYLVHERDIAFSILAQLPNPCSLSEDEQFILAQIVDKVEGAYGGAVSRLEKKWNWEKSKLQKADKEAA